MSSVFADSLLGINDGLGFKTQMAEKGYEVSREGGVQPIPPAAPAAPAAPGTPAKVAKGPDPAALAEQQAAQRAAATAAAGNGSTFLTSGVGLVDKASTEKKRLLGA